MSPSGTVQERCDPDIPINDQCFLLTLPRELRDMIYTWALSHETGLFKDSTPQSPLNELDGHLYVADGSQKCRPNPLKLVCKQLRAETTGLELSLNILTFKGDKARSGALLFRDFMASECSPTHKNHMREVIIADPDTGHYYVDFIGALETVTPSFHRGICAKQATPFKIYLAAFNSSSPFYMWTSVGSVLQKRIHGTIPNAPPHQQPDVDDFVDFFVTVCCGDTPNVHANVRLLPASFDEANFRSDVQGVMGPEQTSKWVQQCHSWVANGF